MSTKENLNVAILQANLEWEDASANRSLFSKKMEALSDSVALIVLPEMFTTGFSMNAENLAEEDDGETFLWMKEQAKIKDSAVTGSVIITENGNYYNRLYFVFPDGSYQKYDKRHTFTLAKEDQTYSAGTDRLIVEYKGWKICPLICYDLRFPVWSRNTEEYDLLIYVANWPKKRVAAWDALLKARAIENLSFCIGLNRVGEDGDGHIYSGHSAVYDCLGKILTEENAESEFSKEITLDKSYLQDTRKQFKFLQDRDQFKLI
ncbi:amidohydrolase [Zunongwangia endophytica]|uniref:Amidohydrolase n=1 Tax=Zunongwangia endophytica TaxID=1808945 RepID=A0ABV8H640_9FLAO|nr:amidohydrolase [Zunongwangia endophytica]MDN3596179.1 amidohydrolase [Zunongwangia endophytica]